MLNTTFLKFLKAFSTTFLQFQSLDALEACKFLFFVFRETKNSQKDSRIKIAKKSIEKKENVSKVKAAQNHFKSMDDSGWS